MSEENVEVVQRAFEHYAATGESLWSAFDEEVEVCDHDILDAGEYRGHAGVGRWLEDWGAAWASYTMEPEEFIDLDDHVVLVIRMKATGHGSGAVVERQDAMAFAVREGKITRLDYYNSKQQALEAVGLRE
jgi:ketosteroid isomerase-like protein